MRYVDRMGQRWRARKAQKWVPDGARVLDVGCHQGEFLRDLEGRIGPSVGIDPVAVPAEGRQFRLLAEPFREPLPFEGSSFDAVVMLATLEHIQDKEPLARECRRLLVPGGRIIISVPQPFVDKICAALVFLRLADGMCLDEHHGFDPAETVDLFTRHGFALEHHSRYQLGCNNLFVFHRKPAA
ncbi:MAG TPA: class I SAM-dependent methyltransferase [Gemmataceae bacterium]|jgi:SAM-dependent methyltransferase|nr:class I SAM-dependent methyltransferase [Gemmataceae bacterium]